MKITQNLLLELFEYRDGDLYNRVFRSPRATKGTIAGSLNPSNGYMRVCVNGRIYQLSRVIWMWHNGDIPEGFEVDHIDQNPMNNRIENLRLLDRKRNEWNKSFANVNFESGKWRARIKRHGKSYHVGMFSSAEQAGQAIERFKRQFEDG